MNFKKWAWIVWSGQEHVAYGRSHSKKTFTTAEIGTRPIRLAEIGAWVKFVVEGAIFGIADPDLPVHLCNFYGATMMIKGSLLLSVPIVKRRW